MVSLLIIDDSPDVLESLAEALAQPGVEVLTASDSESGLDLFLRLRPQVVLADLVMPKLSGLEVLDRIMNVDPGTEVLLMTGHQSTETAVRAIKSGARDYLQKPVSPGTLLEKVGQAVQQARRRQGLPEIEEEPKTRASFQGIIGRSIRMREMLSRIQRVAPHYRTALIAGETGTGKDLVARAIHDLSPAAQNRFVVLNCSAVVETLFESELFGHVKGSFTGATHDKPGLFEYAHGGTLFLDEIGDMPLGTQAKLLRVLQNQEVQRVGALRAQRVDVRVIAATNHDLQAAIAKKRFREDLYYRLSMVVIQTPRLADRKEDLPLLQKHFVARFAAQFGKQIRGLTPRAEMLLAQHAWPGNVRELENVIGHAAMMVVGDLIDVQDLHEYLQTAPGQKERSLAFSTALPAGPELDSFAAQERLLVMRALESSGGNQTQAARILSITRDRLRYKIKKYKLGNSTWPPTRAAAV
jgi:DNA-binding NtrC family response regulator